MIMRLESLSIINTVFGSRLGMNTMIDAEREPPITEFVSGDCGEIYRE